MFATISADIVSSTSLSVDETIRLKQRIEALFALLKTKYPDFYGRQIKGDYIECVMQNVSNVFRIALVIKSCIKSFPITENKKAKNFQTYGIRTAIGIGNMRIVNTEQGIWDGEVRPFVREYGMVIVDECHHVSSITFENVLRHITAHHVYGLTATPIRKDGLQPIIFMQCGPIRFSADAKTQIQKQSFLRYLVPRFTSYRSVTENRQSFALLSQSLAESELRNTLIVEDVLNAVTAGRTPIILTGRTSHVKLLSEMLKPHIANVIQLTGEGTAKSKREVLQGLHDIPQNSPLVIVATGKYVGEGFDYPRLDTLFLALPISWKGLVAQYAGRLHRENEGKADVRIYDYIDIHEPVCESMYRKRLKGYSAIGYRVLSKDCQTLFDATEGLQSSPHEEQIFNGITFCHPFIKELKASRQSIVISSPKLYHMERNKFVNILKELQRDGIEVAILTLTENGQSDYLRRQGLFVKIVPELSLCSCVMDKSSVWYGSINILGYPTEEDNIIRIKDIRLAEEFLDVIYNNGNGK